MIENWRPVVGYEDYYMVSDMGRIKNIAKGMKRQPGRIMVGSINKYGYHSILFSVNMKFKSFRVHRLVAEAFIPNPKNKPQVNHIDANRANNNVSNLEWCTASENAIHAYKLGRMYDKSGDNNGRAKLTPMQVINIMHCKGSISEVKLGKLYGISASGIGRIWRGKRWSSLFTKEVR